MITFSRDRFGQNDAVVLLASSWAMSARWFTSTRTGKAFEVEFTTLDGKTAAVATVEALAVRLYAPAYGTCGVS